MQSNIKWINNSRHLQPTVTTLGLLPIKTVCITLEAGTGASLEWKAEIALAEENAKQGYTIFWDLQFGLFDKLHSPLSSGMQLQALQLALEQFQMIVWEKFESVSEGIFLFRGPVKLAKLFPWNKTQEANFEEWKKNNAALIPAEAQSEQHLRLANYFCLEVAAEYLQLLASYLPPLSKAYLLLNVDAEISLLDEAFMLNQERFGILKTIAIDSKHPLDADTVTIGVCLPPLENALSINSADLECVFATLQAHKYAYRLIPAEQITALWTGLDVLIVQGEHISTLVKRKLQGFTAAGGQIVTCGSNLIGLPEEILFKDWIKN